MYSQPSPRYYAVLRVGLRVIARHAFPVIMPFITVGPRTIRLNLVTNRSLIS